MSFLCRLQPSCFVDDESESLKWVCDSTRGYISDNVAKVPIGFIIIVDFEVFMICPYMAVGPFISDHNQSIHLCT
jgi:hypothetical protein